MTCTSIIAQERPLIVSMHFLCDLRLKSKWKNRATMELNEGAAGEKMSWAMGR
jgi:hypothetical protein